MRRGLLSRFQRWMVNAWRCSRFKMATAIKRTFVNFVYTFFAMINKLIRVQISCNKYSNSCCTWNSCFFSFFHHYSVILVKQQITLVATTTDPVNEAGCRAKWRPLFLLLWNKLNFNLVRTHEIHIQMNREDASEKFLQISLFFFFSKSRCENRANQPHSPLLESQDDSGVKMQPASFSSSTSYFVRSLWWATGVSDLMGLPASGIPQASGSAWAACTKLQALAKFLGLTLW